MVGGMGVLIRESSRGLTRGEGHGARLTMGGRQLIEFLHCQGVSLRAIAAQVGVSASTVKRELDRMSGVYQAVRAREQVKHLAVRPKGVKIEDSRLWSFVVAKLNERWSPCQIVAAWMREPGNGGVRISAETIYQALSVHGRASLRHELKVGKPCVRDARAANHAPSSLLPVRRASHGSRAPGSLIGPRRSKGASSQAIGNGDLIIGKNSKSAAITLVERATGYLLLRPLPLSHDADTVVEALADMIAGLPQGLRRTLTWDQGAEMAKAKELTKTTRINVYFADPHSPWQRGSNENMNGLVRDYFPKGTDLGAYPPEDFEEAQRQLNTRPRQRFNWKTPAELMEQLLHNDAVALTA